MIVKRGFLLLVLSLSTAASAGDRPPIDSTNAFALEFYSLGHEAASLIESRRARFPEVDPVALLRAASSIPVALADDSETPARYVPELQRIELGVAAWRTISSGKRIKEKTPAVLGAYLSAAGVDDPVVHGLVKARFKDYFGSLYGFEEETRAKWEFSAQAVATMVVVQHELSFRSSVCWLLGIIRCSAKFESSTGEELKMVFSWHGSVLPGNFVLVRSPRYISFEYESWSRPEFGQEVERTAISGIELREGLTCASVESTSSRRVHACTGSVKGKRDVELRFDLDSQGRVLKLSFKKLKP